MAENAPRRTWLVAAWPGMGNVAVLAAGYMIQKLGMSPAGGLPPRGHFDVRAVEVREGVIATPRLARNLVYRWTGHPEIDLIVFVGEAQPDTGLFAFAHELLDWAQAAGVSRVVTFASMATQLHPSKAPTVFGAVTEAELAAELKRIEARPLEEGQIAGLNGVLLGACAQRKIPGICLLGEIPFFAAGVPNPAAARVVLQAFSALTGVDIDVSELDEHARAIERALLEMLSRLQAEGRLPEGFGEDSPEVIPESEEEKAEDKPLDFATREKIEQLFEQARADRAKAFELKRFLDAHGVFKQYENRFLDLFKRAE
jgi:predicted ATP-grasp superfamily ATP-dependent carboligase